MKKNIFSKLKTIKNKYLYIITLLFMTMLLGIGYSQTTDINLALSGDAAATPEEEVIITEITYLSSNLADPNDSTIHDSYLTLMNSSIVLGNDLSSTITYKIKVKNLSTIAAIYNEAVYSTELGYDNQDIEFVVNGITTGDTLNPQEEKEFTITFKYKDNLSTITNTTLNSYINFEFNLEPKVARIGSTYYDTLSAAINDVPTNDTETTIELLNNTAEVITIANHQNIVLNMNNNTISNNGNDNVIKNYGKLTLNNGTVQSDAETNGAINVESTGILYLNSVTINVTGGRQAIYNNKGKTTISGNSYLHTTTTQRAALQNLGGGTVTVLSGTIESEGSSACINAGTLIVGTKDGTYNNNSPIFIGNKYGIESTSNYSFYDGKAKGKTRGINDNSKVIDTEANYTVQLSTEVINNQNYSVAQLAPGANITFNANGGTVSEPRRSLVAGSPAGVLPIPTRHNYIFDGWFTEKNGGQQVNENTIINSDVTFYAHWTKITNVVRIGSTYYDTVSDAITHCPDNVQTTIVVEKDHYDSITVGASKDIILDLNGKTISYDGKKAILENSGNISVSNGTLSSSGESATINNNAGNISISANVISTGTKQALYVLGGTAKILAGANLNSQTNGAPTNGDTTMQRGTVQILPNGTVIVLGGTIIGSKQHAISNEGILTIGTKDGNVNNQTPMIRGEAYGVLTIGTFNFYDGTIAGKTDAISGTITDQQTTISTGTIVVDNKTYQTNFNS